MIIFTIPALISVDVFLMFCLVIQTKAREAAEKRAALADEKVKHLEGELKRVEKAREARAVVDAEWPSVING